MVERGMAHGCSAVTRGGLLAMSWHNSRGTGSRLDTRRAETRQAGLCKVGQYCKAKHYSAIQKRKKKPSFF